MNRGHGTVVSFDRNSVEPNPSLVVPDPAYSEDSDADADNNHTNTDHPG